MHKIFVFSNGPTSMGSTYLGVAMAEDGKVLATHCCSNPIYMEHDLGITSIWNHDKYDAHYGAGNWELEWVPAKYHHDGLKKALVLNRNFGRKTVNINF